ncbi:MAG: NAD-dependent epimerase/dehydratase family protein [Marinicaulis sp.]|nr:NAD-dependent epimerase/dehydratase family protein [Marinicaulis sp.]
MNSEKIRVGLLGAGYISSWHLNALKRNSDVEVVAVCDLSESAAHAIAAAAAPAKVYTALDTMMAEGVCDAIHVLTPPNAHYANAKDIISAGAHVFLEKPATLSAKESNELGELAIKKGVQIGVNHNFLMLPSYDHLKRDIESKRIGPIDTIEINWQFPLAPLRSGPFGLWMLRQPGNILFEIGSHLFAFVADLFGELSDIHVRLKNPITIPGGVTHFQSWQITGVSAGANITLNISMTEGHDNRSVSLRGAGAAAKYDFANDVYRYEQAPMNDIVIGPLAAQLNLAGQALSTGCRNAVRQIISLNSLSPYGLSISRAVDAFYRAISLSEVLDQRLSISRAASATALIEQTLDAAAENVSQAQTDPIQSKSNNVAAENGKTVLVIGGTGFIGRYLVTALADKGYHVRVFSRGKGGGLERCDGRVSIYTGDLKSMDDLQSAMVGVTGVFHLARAAETSWEGYLENDVAVTKGIGEAALSKNVERFIYTGTIDSYDASQADRIINEDTPFDENLEQRNLYARSKAACEETLKILSTEKKLPLTIVRPGIVIGRGGPLQHWGIAMWRGATACKLWGDGKNILPFVLADDVADGLVNSLEAPGAVGKSYNLIGEPMLSAVDYFAAVSEVNRVSVRAKPTPIWTYFLVDIVKYWAKRLLAKKSGLTKPSFRDWKSRAQLSPYDNSRAKTELEWNPEADPDQFVKRGIVDANLFGYSSGDLPDEGMCEALPQVDDAKPAPDFKASA